MTDKVQKAYKAKTTMLVYARNKAHKVYHIDSIGSGQPYQIFLDWEKKSGVLTLRTYVWSYDPKLCHPKFDNLPKKEHPANYNKTICHMSLAAAKKAARDAGKVLSVCKSLAIAKKLLNLGGQLVRITNMSGASVWATVR